MDAGGGLERRGGEIRIKVMIMAKRVGRACLQVWSRYIVTSAVNIGAY